jgi:hypothetical protein
MRRQADRDFVVSRILASFCEVTNRNHIGGRRSGRARRSGQRPAENVRAKVNVALVQKKAHVLIRGDPSNVPERLIHQQSGLSRVTVIVFGGSQQRS